MDEQLMNQTTKEVLADKSSIFMGISIPRAWAIVSALGLAIKHPGLSANMKAHLRLISKQRFESAIKELHPDADVLLERESSKTLEGFLASERNPLFDDHPLNIAITVMEAWLLVSAVQLVTRHPDLPADLKDYLIFMARQLQDVISRLHPAADEILNMGWDSRYDQ